MKVLYQPTQAAPGDWQECDSKRWGRLGEFTIHALCVQGDIYEGPDHYAVRDVGSGLVSVTVWHDDYIDWPVGTRWAKVVTYSPLGPDPRPEHGGAINVLRKVTIYADDESLFRSVYGAEVEVRSWDNFDHSREKAMHGVWVSDEAHEAHKSVRAARGWREWTEGVHPTLLDASGRVRDQRKAGRYERPKGTRTYYHNNVQGSQTAHPAASHRLDSSPAGQSSFLMNIGTSGETVCTATTDADEPASAAWPTSGVYRAQLDVVAVGADLVFGLLPLDGAVGHFGRLNAGVTSCLENFAQDQSAFFGSGLHLATKTDPAWTPGSAVDRFGISIAAWRTAGHGAQPITLQLGETDDFVDGPWSSGPTPPSDDNAPFFGAHF